jgi:hypothetical protein
VFKLQPGIEGGRARCGYHRIAACNLKQGQQATCYSGRLQGRDCMDKPEPRGSIGRQAHSSIKLAQLGRPTSSMFRMPTLCWTVAQLGRPAHVKHVQSRLRRSRQTLSRQSTPLRLVAGVNALAPVGAAFVEADRLCHAALRG